MKTVDQYMKETFGEKVYKLTIDGGFTCPNRDGTCGTRGCIFCLDGGSGGFIQNVNESISSQIDNAKKLVASKYKGNKYIAYFQAYTNTYAPVSYLRELFIDAISRPDIVGLSIATRPDCLPDDVLELLKELNCIKPVWVELGLQTSKESTAEYIRRGYSLDVYDKAISDLNNIGIHTITHVILGLPGETESDMVATVQHVVDMRSKGIKLQLLYVLKGTDLAIDYSKGVFKVMSLDEYIDILRACLKIVPNDMVVHRLTGDGGKRDLIAPKWSADKKSVLNAIRCATKDL